MQNKIPSEAKASKTGQIQEKPHNQVQSSKDSSSPPHSQTHRDTWAQTEAFNPGAEAKIESLTSELSNLKQNYDQCLKDLASYKKFAELHHSQKCTIDQLTRQVSDLTQKLIDLESQYMMKVHKRMQNIDYEIKDQMLSQLPKWQSAATLIQSNWRGKLARKQYMKVIQTAHETKQSIRKTGNSTLIQKFVRLLKRQKLTLEEVFRASDLDGDKVVSCEEFTRFLSKLKLDVQALELARLIEILDEDLSGKLESQEFYETLAAYQVITDSSQVKGYSGQVLNKFLSLIKENSMRAEEVFNSCDRDNSQSIELAELGKVCQALGMLKRESMVLMDLLDVDGNGVVSKTEFLRKIKDEESLFKIEIEKSTSAMPRNISSVISCIESSGMTLTKAFDLIHFPESGRVKISYISGSFSKLFTNILKEDIDFLLSTIDNTKTGFINYKDLISFLHSYTGTTEFTDSQIKQHMTSALSTQKLSISESLSIQGFSSILDINNFLSYMKQAFDISEQQGINLFNSLSHFSGRVTLQDLNNFLNITKENRPEDPGSPRTYSSDLVQEIVKLIEKNQLKVQNVFKFADCKNTGRCSSGDFCSSLKKLVKGIEESKLLDLIKVLPPTFTLKDLEVIMPSSSQSQVDEFGMTEEAVFWIATLKLAIQKMSVDPIVIFNDADNNKDRKVSMEEFKNALKRCVPGAVLTYTDICLIFKAFDKDSSWGIDQGEFLSILQNVSKSKFFNDVVGKIQEQHKQNGFIKATLRPKLKSDDFPIPPLPLMHLSKRQDCHVILERFASEIPSSTLTSEFLGIFNLRLSALITSQHIGKIFNLTPFEADKLFSFIDLHNRGLTYCFVLCTVIDSYRMSLTNFPIPHNQSADSMALKILEKMKIGLGDQPVFKCLQPLDKMIQWENFTSLPLDPQEVYSIKAAFPRQCFNYHLASALLNLSVGFVLCPVEILHNSIKKLEFIAQGSEFFEKFSLHPMDSLNRSEFVNKFSRILEISVVEADTLFTKFNKSKETCKLFTFFTFFDMVLSMYHRGDLVYPLPSLPFSTEKNINLSKLNFFSKLSNFIDKPFIRYGLNLSQSYSVGEISKSFEGFDSDASETETYLQLLLMNKNKFIKLYHLAAVLDTYDTFNKSLVSALNLEPLKIYFSSGKVTGLSLIKVKYLTIDQTLVLDDLKHLLPMTPAEYLNTLFNYIDTFGRGYIYGHQMATVLDISFKTDSFHCFPFYSNQEMDKAIRSLISSNSRHLDVYSKTAFAFYSSNQVNFEEELDMRRFQVTFNYEFTDDEAEKVFRAIDFRNIGKIKVYHYVACVESFCRNTMASIQILQDSPLHSLIKVALAIPDDLPTPEYFNDLTWYSLLTKDGMVHYLTQKFSFNIQVIHSIISEIADNDENYSDKSLFFYQFLTLVDVYRNCVEKGKIIRQPTFPPFKNKPKELQTELIINNFANKLDSQSKGSCDYFWSKGLDPTEDISIQEFFVSFPELNSQQCSQLFKELNFKKTGIVNLYHFLAVVESFREKKCENKYKPVFSKRKVRTSNVLPMVVSPLQDAFNRLGRYIAGDNPKRRALTSNEIFGMMDYNSDGTVTMNEFLDCLNLLPLNLSQNQIYALLKEADLNGDGFINYKEFTNFILDFVKKPEIKELPSVVITKPEIREVKGLQVNKTFPPDSIEEAIMNLKIYIESNKASFTSIELVFGKIDYMSTGSMKPDEFNLALDRLKLPFSNRQKSSLAQLADKNQSKLIPYKDFIDFLYNYSFEEIQEASTVGVSVTDYILTPQDFFTKYYPNTTILNSEKAALKRCYELLHSCPKFRDPDFGPEKDKNGSYCLYFKGKAPTSSYPKPSNLSWPDLQEVLQHSKFFKDHISSNDVIQGSLANCWFIGALSVLATRDELVRGSIQELSVSKQIDQSTAWGVFKGVYPPIFHPFGQKGLFVVRLFKDFAWRYVIIDSRVPMCKTESGYKYVFGQCSDPGELWVPLIEKAYSKLHGCYESLNNGLIDDALVDLTGFVADRVALLGQPPDELWKKMIQLKESGSLLGCSIENKDGHSEVVVEGEPSGLLAKHAYGIVDIFEVKSGKAKKGRHRLIRIRNPWGQREWKGKWSSGDEKLRSNLKEINDFLLTRPGDEAFDPLNDKDGTFLMCFKDWRTIFTFLFSCVDFPDHWSGFRMLGAWSANSAGGVPSGKTKKEIKIWGQNPQFFMDLKENSEVFISLSQKDARFLCDAFPYKKSLFYICFSVMKLEGNETKLEEFDEFRIVKLSKLRLHREVHLRTVLSAGRYALVPATKKPGQFGEFCLSVYFSCPKSSISLTSESGLVKVIEEEEEKTQIDPETIKLLRNTFEQVSKF